MRSLVLPVVMCLLAAAGARAQALPEGLLPDSTVSRGSGTIESAWLASPTRRYAHGVLGDDLEAGRVVARTRDGREHAFDLPVSRVFEDLNVRLADLDDDGTDEMIVVESDAELGASLAVYGLSRDGIVLRARSPFIGTANRWLNPVGAGDFDGDGRLELALVRTPHIGGVLEVYRFTEPTLTRIASRGGYSTHTIGSTELGLGAVVPGAGRARMLLPDQARRALVLVEMYERDLRESGRLALAAPIVTSLRPDGAGGFDFETTDGVTRRVDSASFD